LAEQKCDILARTYLCAKLAFHDFEGMLAHPESHAAGRACPSIVEAGRAFFKGPGAGGHGSRLDMAGPPTVDSRTTQTAFSKPRLAGEGEPYDRVLNRPGDELAAGGTADRVFEAVVLDQPSQKGQASKVGLAWLFDNHLQN
jgi:hypothetical protein